jgi:hypothetical protein
MCLIHPRCTLAASLLVLAAGCGRPAAPSRTAPRPAPSEAAAAEPELKIVRIPPPDSFERGPSPNRQPTWPPLEFQPVEMNFGVLDPGTAGQGVTRVWNTGDKPLRILKSITSCGCTSAQDLSGRTIPPGGSIDFTTTMEMKSGLGDKMEKVTIFFEGYGNTQVVYFYKAEVSRAVRAIPPYMTADDRGRPILSGELVLEARDGRAFRVLAAHGRAPEFVGFDPARDQPAARYTIRWDITPEHQAGAVPWFWVFETDHPDAPLVDVRVRHASTMPAREQGAWVPKDQRLILDLLRAGVPTEVTAKVEYNGGFTPDASGASISGPGERFAVELAEAKVDGRLLKFRIRVTPRPGPPGLIYEEIALHASGHSAPLRLIGKLVE